jgi:hypothetical protein
MRIAIIGLLLLAAVTSLAAPLPPSLNSADDPLPDPLVMKDGTPVSTVGHWEARRAEILQDILAIQYGHMPATTPEVKVVRVRDYRSGGTQYGHLRRAKITTGPNQEIPIQITMKLPKQDNGPYPVIVKIGQGHPDEDGVNKRGYAIVMFNTAQLDPGDEGRDIVGPAQLAYPELDWGSLATWAWGASRVMDFLETQKDIDASRAIVTGHSRTGKAALLAGAIDQRFKLVVPNGSGCGGAATYRNYHAGAETLELLTRPERWLFWMQKDIRRFVGRETELPFDQHFMRALVAPRVVLSNDGLDDAWANNFGTQAGYQGAQPVFDLLSVPKHNLAKFREGGHTFNEEDAKVMLDVADWLFKGAEFPENMNNLPQPDYEVEIFSSYSAAL